MALEAVGGRVLAADAALLHRARLDHDRVGAGAPLARLDRQPIEGGVAFARVHAGTRGTRAVADGRVVVAFLADAVVEARRRLVAVSEKTGQRRHDVASFCLVRLLYVLMGHGTIRPAVHQWPTGHTTLTVRSTVARLGAAVVLTEMLAMLSAVASAAPSVESSTALTLSSRSSTERDEEACAPSAPGGAGGTAIVTVIATEPAASSVMSRSTPLLGERLDHRLALRGELVDRHLDASVVVTTGTSSVSVLPPIYCSRLRARRIHHRVRLPPGAVEARRRARPGNALPSGAQKWTGTSSH